MPLVYVIVGWLLIAALFMMLTRRSWWEWDPTEPRPRPAPIQRPRQTADRLAQHA
jgi:hypothetical protein